LRLEVEGVMKMLKFWLLKH